MSGLNNKKYLDGDGLLKFWDICCANFPHKDGRGATGDWKINAATATNASAANKLNTNAGSATKPIYFGDGIPKQCNDLIDVNISGNAATADEADNWSNARKITLTGGVTGEVDIDGSEDVEIATTVVSTAHTHNQYYDKNTTQSPNTVYAGPSSGTAAGVASFRKLVDKDIPDLSGIYLPKSGGTLQGDSADLLVINRLSSTSTAYITFKGNNSLLGRIGFNSDGFPVVQVPSIGTDNQLLIHSGNFNTYSPKLDGTGATGTWPISILGNAATASSAAKLTTACKLWGQNFNGEADVAGDLTGVGSITMSGSIAYTTQVIGTKPTGASYASWRIVPYNGSLLIQASGDNGTTKTGKINLEGYEGGKLSQLYVGATNATFSDNVNATKFIGALQGNADSATTVSSFTTASGDPTKRYVWMSWSDNTGKAAYSDKLTFQTSTNTLFSNNFAGNLTGNATSATTADTATNLANKPVLAVSSTNSKQITVTAGEKPSEPFTVPYATTADTAAKTAGTLTLKITSDPAKTFNGSEDVEFEVTAAKLGLTKAVLYLGKSTTAITDGGTEKPTIVIDGVNTEITTLSPGNIVIDSSDSREYIWNGSNWEKFGLDGDGAAGNYKPVQTAIDSPSTSGNDISFIDTISQDINGVIKPTRKTVRSATASQSGVVTTAAQTFAGAKTFNGGIIGNLTGNVTGNVTGNADTATNADMLDNLHASSFARVSTYPTTSDNNWNISSGIYSTVSNTEELPLPNNGNHVIHCNWDGNAANQLFLAYDRDLFAFRRKQGNVWQPWKTVAFTSDIPTKVSQLTNDANYTTATGHTHSYLPLSGGTITSTTAPPLKINTSYNANGAANSWIGAIHCFNASLSANQHFTLDIGKAASSKNEGWLGFYYVADGSNDNRLSLGLHSMDDVVNVFGSGNVSIGNAQNTTAEEKLHVHGNVKATKFIGPLQGNADSATTMSSFTAASGDATKRYVWMSYNDNTGKPAYTDKLTFRTSTNTLFVNDTAVSLEGHTHSYVPIKSVVFTPAETAIGPADVLSKLGSGTALGKGTWDYAGNGYISKDTTGSIAIDLAGCSVIQLGNSSAYTQLYITAPASTTGNSKTNEILFYNNHGSSYAPAWTRVLTDRNYSEYCAAKSHGTHVSGNAAFTSQNSTAADCNNVTYNLIGYYTTNGPSTTLGANATDGALYSQAWSDSWVAQIAQDYRNGNLFTRGKNNGTWTAWKAVSYDGHGHSQIVGNANSANAANALLMTGAGRPDTSPAGDTWIFVDSAGSMSAPWGFKHEQADNLIGFYGAGARNAYIDLSNGQFRGSNFITASDRRLKNNITEIVDASKSLELGFYEFDYKSGGHSAGHIAQEVREVLPEFVHGEETETTHLSVDYTGLHSVQIKALKDEVDTLKTENKELRERLEKLEALIEKLV